MNNTDYVEKMFNKSERVYVDTCTLMKSGFQQFISRNKELLKSYGKPIIVIKAVYAELNRKLRDPKLETVQAAVKALGLIKMFNELFQVECSLLTEEEIENAFADPCLLSALTLERNKCRQLLIVNDRNLSEDAYRLNFQSSCNGHRVYVCFIDWNGELHCSDCVRNSMEDIKIETTQVANDKIIQITRSEKTSDISDKSNTDWKFDWKSGVMVATGTIVFYGIYRLIKAIT